MFNKYFISIILLILIVSFKFYKYSVQFKKNILNKIEGIYSKNDFNFLKKLKDKCSNDDCLLSYNMVKYVKNMVKNIGLSKTLNYMRNNRDIFTTSKGEYVWIHTIKKDGERFFIYHHHLGLDNKNMINAQKSLNKTCSEEFCPVDKIIKELTSFADKYNEGFYEYKWFNPKTKDIIIKRSFIDKLEKIKTQFKKDDTIYIGSGATIEAKESEIDIANTIISVLITCLFLSTWKIFNIDELFDKSLINIFFYTILSLNLYNLFNSNFELRSIDKIEDEHNTITQTSISLAGLGLALAFFFSEVLSNKDKYIKKNSIKLLSLSIVFSLLSFIKLKIKINSKNLGRKVEIKNGFLLSSVTYIIMALVYVYNQY